MVICLLVYFILFLISIFLICHSVYTVIKGKTSDFLIEVAFGFLFGAFFIRPVITLSRYPLSTYFSDESISTKSILGKKYSIKFNEVKCIGTQTYVPSKYGMNSFLILSNGKNKVCLDLRWSSDDDKDKLYEPINNLLLNTNVEKKINNLSLMKSWFPNK